LTSPQIKWTPPPAQPCVANAGDLPRKRISARDAPAGENASLLNHSRTPSLPHSLTPSLTPSLAHSLTHSLKHIPDVGRSYPLYYTHMYTLNGMILRSQLLTLLDSGLSCLNCAEFA